MGRDVLAVISNNETTPDLIEGQSLLQLSELTSDIEPSNVSEPSVFVWICQSLEEVQKH